MISRVSETSRTTSRRKVSTMHTMDDGVYVLFLLAGSEYHFLNEILMHKKFLFLNFQLCNTCVTVSRKPSFRFTQVL